MAGDLEVGAVLAGYRIEGLAGRGGMGVVYVAEHVHLGRRVALKVLAPELAADESFRERFIRESRLAAAIEHPNAIPVYDAGEADGVLYIAMRLVQGTDLRAVIDHDGRVEPARALAILGAVAGALDMAHADGLVHRDVKPANILLEANRRGGEDVFLTDFGLTKRMGPGSRFTKTGSVVGTLDYMAPEQIQGAEVSGRADEYALGCVLFECLTGRPPYPRETEVAAMYAHLEEPPPAITSRRPDLPTAVDAVVARSMAKSPVERFATCGELVEAARAGLGDAALAADGASSVSAGGSPPAAPAVPSAIRSAVRRAAPPAAAPPGAPPAHRRRTALIVGAVVVALALIGTTIAIVAGGSGTDRTAGTPTGLPSHGPSVVPSNASPGVSPKPVGAFANGRVAFVENGNVNSVDAEGNDSIPLTSSLTRATDELDGDPVWSPDGTAVALLRTSNVGSDVGIFPTHLVVVPVEATGGPGTEFSPSNQTFIGTPAWAPDGGSLAYIHTPFPKPTATLTVVSARSGSKPSPVAFDVENSGVAYSDDGSVLFAVDSRTGDVMGFRIAGGLSFPIASGPGAVCCPQVSPDGRMIALVANRTGTPRLEVAKSDGGSGTEIPNALPERDTVPRWSPDGTKLLFVSKADGDEDVWVANADGSGVQNLTGSPGADREPVWSPDGTMIAFTSARDGHAQIYVMNADGTNPVNVSNSQFADTEPSWQPVPAAATPSPAA
ncbi:MAG TPA: protein kinase [Actinomycetota bacterium]|nr:protein kinase [Actinomycetota bacterium]